MAVSFQVTPELLRQRANEIRSQKKRMEALLQSFISQEGALNAMWDGEANDAFHREFSKSSDRIEYFCGMAGEFADALDGIAADYQLAESKNVSIAGTRGM